MLCKRSRGVVLGSRRLAPRTVRGGPDPDFDDAERHVHHVLLTDPGLLARFRRHFPTREDTDYDEMVRLLGDVWDCPHDGTANVVGTAAAVADRPGSRRCGPVGVTHRHRLLADLASVGAGARRRRP